MKKTYVLYILVLILVSFSASCTRKDPGDPGDLFGPSSFHYIVEGSASPSVLWVNGVNREVTQIRVHVTDYQGNPIVGKYVYFEQMGVSNGAYTIFKGYGWFENYEETYRRRTDANGWVQVTYYGPLIFGSHKELFIHALVEDLEQTYKDAPEDYIRIQLVDALDK